MMSVASIPFHLNREAAITERYPDEQNRAYFSVLRNENKPYACKCAYNLYMYTPNLYIIAIL